MVELFRNLLRPLLIGTSFLMGVALLLLTAFIILGYQNYLSQYRQTQVAETIALKQNVAGLLLNKQRL